MNFSEYISADRTIFLRCVPRRYEDKGDDDFHTRATFCRTARSTRRSTRLRTHARAKNINARDYARTRRTFNAYPPLAGKMRFAKAL